MPSDVVQLRINVAAAEGLTRVGSIVVLVPLVRRLETFKRENKGMHRLARLVGKAGYRQLGLMPLAILKDVDCTAVFAYLLRGERGLVAE